MVTGAYQYTLLVRWGSTWVNEAARCEMVSGHNGRQFYIQRGATTFEQIQPGEFDFSLDNFDGRYDPYNSGGALYGNIRPGRAVQFRVKIVSSGLTKNLFTGRIKDIIPVSGMVNMVQMQVVDGMQWLADQDTVPIPTAYNITVGAAIRQVLDACRYPYPRQVSDSACPVYFFDPQEANGLDVIRQLADAGLGTVFVDKSGVFRYYDLKDADREEHNIDQAILHKEIAVRQPWETVRNRVTTIANRYGYGPLEEIWRLDEPIKVPGNSSVTLKIEFEAARVIQPVRYTDYWSGSGLEGFVPGVGFTSEQFFITAILTNITSTSANLVLTNSVYNFLYVKKIVVRGNKLVNKKLPFDALDQASIDDYGPRKFIIDSPFLQDRGFAEAYSDLLIDFLKDPSKGPIVVFENRDEALDIELLDQINLTSAKLGIDEQYDVGGFDYHWLGPTGQGWQMTFYLQNILYSTDTITPQPFYPETPPVPPEQPPPPGPPTETTSWKATLECLAIYPVPGGPTGPYNWPPGEMNNSSPALMGTEYWFRSYHHPNRTYVEIDGSWETLQNGLWVADGSWDFTDWVGYSLQGFAILNGTLDSPMVAQGTRRYVFDNPKGSYVRQMDLTLPPADITDGWTFNVPITNGILGADYLGGSTATENHDFSAGTFHLWQVMGFGQETGSQEVTYIPAGLVADINTVLKFTVSTFTGVAGRSATLRIGMTYGGDPAKYDVQQLSGFDGSGNGETGTYSVPVNPDYYGLPITRIDIQLRAFDSYPDVVITEMEFLTGAGTPYTRRIIVNAMRLFNACKGDPSEQYV